MARFLSRRMRVLLLLAVLWAMSTVFWRSYRTPELEAHKLKVQQKTEEMNALLGKLNAVCLVPRRPSLPSCGAACAYLPHLRKSAWRGCQMNTCLRRRGAWHVPFVRAGGGGPED